MTPGGIELARDKNDLTLKMSNFKEGLQSVM